MFQFKIEVVIYMWHLLLILVVAYHNMKSNDHSVMFRITGAVWCSLNCSLGSVVKFTIFPNLLIPNLLIYKFTNSKFTILPNFLLMMNKQSNRFSIYHTYKEILIKLLMIEVCLWNLWPDFHINPKSSALGQHPPE